MKYRNTLNAVLHLYDARFVNALYEFELNDEELQNAQVQGLIANKTIVEVATDEEKINLSPIIQQIEAAVINTIVQDVTSNIDNDINNLFKASPVVDTATPLEEPAKASSGDPILAENEDDSTKPNPASVKKPISTTKKYNSIT